MGSSSAAGNKAWAGKRRQAGKDPTRKGVEGKGNGSTGDRPRAFQFGVRRAQGENDALGSPFPAWGHRMSHQDLQKDPLLEDTDSCSQSKCKLGRVAGQVSLSAEEVRARASPVGLW